MNKEIKFRAWNSNLNRMIYSEDEHQKTAGWWGTIILSKENLGENIMQYTGLLDKNGKEIYEGDILMIGGKKVEVKPLELFECDAFVVYGYGFCSNFFIDNYDKVGLNRFYSENPEIIGNIYENPELI